MNVGAIEEFQRVNERYTYLTDQRDDVAKAKKELEEIIAGITSEMKTIFQREFRTTLLSSKAASISSMTTKGVGRTFKIAKYRAMATKAFSPPDSRVMIFRPGTASSPNRPR